MANPGRVPGAVQAVVIQTNAYKTIWGKATVIVDEYGYTFVSRRSDSQRITKRVGLTDDEQELMLFLAEGMGQNRTYRMLAGVLSKPGEDLNAKDVAERMARLRSKLRSAHPDAQDAIRTVWGRGFAFGNPAATPVHEPREALSLPDVPKWHARVKERICAGIEEGRTTVEHVLARYPDLSREELAEWQALYREHGKGALQANQILPRKGS